jgi:hypothetical protein
MVDLDTLQKKALADCLAFAEEHLSGEFRAEPVPMPADEALSWDPMELRYVADQTVVLWRRYSQFEVVLDAEDRVVGYVDHDKWLKCRWEELPEEEALSLARTSGLLRPELKLVEARKGEGDCLELYLREQGRNPPPGLVVRINPALRVVISILPEEEARP